MIRNKIISALNQYLGKYFEGLEENFNYSFWGNATLTDLKLRPEALVELLTLQLGKELPIEVKAGHVDFIKFSFPWHNLWTADIKLELNGLYILAGPVTDRLYNEELDKKLQTAIKTAILAASEKAAKSALQDVSDQAESHPGLFDKLLKYTLNNVQVTVNNIHIRYEDSETNGDYSFAVGATLKTFSIHSTNDKWEEAEIDSSAKVLHKLGRLVDLSVYWNHYVQEPDLVGRKNRLKSNSWKDLLKSSVDTYRIKQENFKPILQPVSAEAKIIMNNMEDYKTPVVYVDFTLKDVQVLFSRNQYLSFTELTDSMLRMLVNKRYRKYRPSVPVQRSARSWWIYAYESIVEERIRPFSFNRITKNMNQFHSYSTVYLKHLADPENKMLVDELRSMEEDMNVVAINNARGDALAKYLIEKPKTTKPKEKEKVEPEPKSWYDWFWGTESSGKEEEEEEVDVEGEKDWISGFTDEERKELYAGIGFDENANELKMPKEYVAYKAQVNLKRCRFMLENYSKTILQVSLSDMAMSFDSRPGGNGSRWSSKTEGFTIEGASVDYELVSLVTSNGGIYSTDSQMFSLEYEVRPLWKDADHSLKLNVRPVEVFYDEHAVSQLLAFFQIPDDMAKENINKVAVENMKRAIEYSQDTIRYAIQQKSRFHVSIHMRSPYIVIPQKGTLHQEGNVLIVDLGLLTVESELQPADATDVKDKNDLYNKFKINVTQVKALLADSSEDWHLAATEANSGYHILPSTGLEVSFYKMWLQNKYDLPQHKINAKVQSLTVNLTDEQLLILYTFIFHFPIPSVSVIRTSVDGGPYEASFPKLDMKDVQLDPDINNLVRMRKSILRRSVIDTRRILTKPADSYTDRSQVDGPVSGRLSFSVVDEKEDDIQKWLSFLNVKTVDDFLSTNNHMKMFIRATIGELVLQISLDPKTVRRENLDQRPVRKEYLMFRMDHICMDAASTIYVKDSKIINSGAAFYASIGGMQMADKLHRGGSGAYLELLKTQSDRELISISYRQVKPDCPDFSTVYKHIEHAAALNFHQISFIIDQTGVCYLKKFVQDVQSRITEQENNYKKEKSPYPVNFPVRPKPELKPKKLPSKRSSVLVDFITMVDEVEASKPDIIKVHLITSVDDISVQLSNIDVKYADLHIMGLQGQFIARSDRKTFNARLKELSVADMSHDTKYPQILMLDGKDDPFFDFKFQQFIEDKDKNKTSPQALDYSIMLRIGHVQVAYLNKFIWQVTRFFEPIRVPNVAERANAAVREVTKQVTELDPQTNKIKVSIFVHIPTIVVPKHSKSPDLFWVQFGDLSVVNNFSKPTTSPGGRLQEWNVVSVSLTHMQISRGKLMGDKFVILHDLVEPVNFKASIGIAIAPFVTNVMYDISGHLDLIKADILHTDLKLLLAVQRYNLMEGAPLSSLDAVDPMSTAEVVTTVDSMEVTADVQADVASGTSGDQGGDLNKSFNAVITMQGVILCLSEEKERPDSTNDERSPLSRIEIGQLEARANSWVDTDLKLDVNVALHTMSIDDTRPDSSLAVKQIFLCTRRHGPEESQLLPLISVIYKVHADGRQEADVKMEKVILHVHIPYIMALLDVYNSALPSDKELPTPSISSSTRALNAIPPPEPPAPPRTYSDSNLTLYGTVNEPEIVLFGDPEKQNSRILVVNGDIEFDVLSDGPIFKFRSKFKNLKMFTSFYGQEDKAWVIHPCTVDFDRSFNSVVNMTEMSISLPKLDFYISPSVLILIYDVLKMTGEKEEKIPEKPTPKKELTQLWGIKKTSADNWMKNLEGKEPDINPLIPQGVPKEILKIDIGELNTYFRIRNMDYNLDLLYAHLSLEGEVHDWSGKMHVNAEMRLRGSYFNEKIGVWEPLIEPVCDTEGIYRPWELIIKVIKGKSYPMSFNYDHNGFNMEDCLRNDVQQLLRNRRSSSSESETDESTEMTVLRSTMPRKRSHIASDSSYHEVIKNQNSLQGESDSEPDGLIHTITSKLGGIFSDDSSEDADISETDENDENFDPAIDKPVFLTPKGPMQVSREQDYVDSGPDRRLEEEPVEPEVTMEEENEEPQCYYVIVASQDKLLLNVTPTALNLLSDVAKAFSNPRELDIVIKDLPNFEIINEIGVSASVFLHPDVKVHKKHVSKFTVYKTGEDDNKIKIINPDDDKLLDIVDEGIGESQTETLGLLVNNSNDANMSCGSGLLIDNRDLSNEELVRSQFKIQLDGFDLSGALLHNRECRRLIALSPMQHGTKYCLLLNIDLWHGRRVITFQSPLKVKNNLNMPITVYCKTDDLREFKQTDITMESGELTKLVTLGVKEEYCVPLFLAYNSDLFICPDDPRYKVHQKGISWRELLLIKDNSKYYPCRMEENKSDQLYNIKVKCKPGPGLKPTADIPKDIPYYILQVSPPVILHNNLPYDLQFSMEETGSFKNVKPGEMTEITMIEMSNSHKLHLQLRDYLGCDWMGIYTVSQDYEDYKTVSMSPFDFSAEENSNTHLGILVFAKMDTSLTLNIYSPYWIVNKTELPVMMRGANSDAVFDCSAPNTPILFRYKKNKRKKAKLKVYESRWSKSFSLDAMGNVGVVICVDRERNRKYRLMVQLEYNYLTFTMMVTITPYFLVVNKSLHNLRYMEENEDADLWIDLPINECQPFWPVTNSEKMHVEYEESNVVSEHFPFNTVHNTVLRMENGKALTVEVTGGFQTPRQVTFKQYDVGDAPVRIENLCDDVFIVIHQRELHQKTMLASNQSLLYTWDDPAGCRKLMWNVVGGTTKDMELDITKDRYDLIKLSVQFVQASGTYNYKEKSNGSRPDSSPEDDSDAVDVTDGTPKHQTKLKTKSYGMTIYWVSLLHENQRVVIFTDNHNLAKAARMALKYGVDHHDNTQEHASFTFKFNEGEYSDSLLLLSLDSVYVSVVNSMYEEVALLSVSSMPAVWEIEVKSKWKVLEDVTLVTWLEDKWVHGLPQASLEDRIEVDFVKMQMTKPYMGELRRVAPPGLYLQYRKSEHQFFFHTKVHRLQIDNQLNDAHYQTVLHPAPIPMYLLKKKGPKPFIEFGMIRRTVPENNVDTMRQWQLILQECCVELDWGFIETVTDVFYDWLDTGNQDSTTLLVESDIHKSQKSLKEMIDTTVGDEPNKVFYEFFKISPLKLNLSFSFRGNPHYSRYEPVTFGTKIKDFIRNSITTTFTEVRDVQLKLAYYERRGVLHNFDTIRNDIKDHYVQQFMMNLYVLVFGLDVLGNPYGLFSDFQQGLGDLFYEPILDTIQGEDDLSENVIQGFQSAMGHIVGGTANSVARVTGVLGSTFASLSLDKEFQNKRRRRMQQKPTNMPHSLALAGKGFLSGVSYGLSGIVLDPIQGASDEGVEGFFKGVGKGILGLLTQPIGGVLDMVSLAFDGVRRTAEMEGGIVIRMRLPRFIDPNKGLEPYSDYKSRGNNILHRLKDGRYMHTDTFVDFAPLSQRDKAEIIVITNRRIMYLEKNRIFSGYDVEWEVELKDIVDLTQEQNKLVLNLKTNSASMLSSNSVEIESNDKEILNWLHIKIKHVLRRRVYI